MLLLKGKKTTESDSLAVEDASPCPLAGKGKRKAGGELRPGKEWIMTEKELLAKLLADNENCLKCGLGRGRKKLVFGEGNPRSRIFLLGEAPGAKEDETGRPFVGRAGELLTELLALDGIDRQDVYITGSCKCRPPKTTLTGKSLRPAGLFWSGR